jgi:hypothetical protein
MATAKQPSLEDRLIGAIVTELLTECCTHLNLDASRVHPGCIGEITLVWSAYRENDSLAFPESEEPVLEESETFSPGRRAISEAETPIASGYVGVLTGQGRGASTNETVLPVPQHASRNRASSFCVIQSS